MTTPKKKTSSQIAAPRGRKAMLERQSQGLTPSPSMQVPHLPMTQARKQTFLEYIAANGSAEQSARQVDGFDSVRSYRRLFATDPGFKNKYDDALASFAGRVNQALIEEAVEGVESYVVSAGEVVTNPETDEPLKVRKREPKLLAMLARSLNAKLRDVKTVVTVDGKVIDSDQDPSAVVLSSDLWQLSSTDSAELLRILKIIHTNRNIGLELQAPMKTIEGEVLDAEFSEVIPNESAPSISPLDPTIDYDPWEIQESENVI